MSRSSDNSDRSIVVTGASSGIGKGTALQLDSLGFRVFATYRKDADAEALRTAASDALIPIRLDVADSASIAAAAEEIAGHLEGRGLDGLVNNAGMAVASPLEFVPVEALRQQLEVNVVGQVAVTQALLDLIRKAKGRIVNVGSIGGLFASPFVGPYCASKFAMEGITDSLRIELLPWGIHVSIIEPGAIDTPIWKTSGERAAEMRKDFPAEAMTLYGKAIEGMTRRISNMKGTAVEPVADAIIHALTSDKPKTRYIVGHDAKVRRILTWLPDRLRDRIVARTIYG